MIKKGWDKPFVILLFFMAVVAVHFWTTSRYPNLAAKAVLNTNAPLSGLGFSPVVEIKDSFSVSEKIFWNTINWMDTNKKGMTFSFMFGAFFLALIPCFNIRRSTSGFKSSLLGLGIGTPLGVCVNCAAPIARAMQASGYPFQTALAALIASPSLNLVVLMMAFSMFPFHVVAVRILLLLVFILVLIPLASRLFFSQEVAFQDSGETLCETPVTKKAESVVFAEGLKGWGQAVLWSIKAYVFAFLKLLWIALPLMILAGFLGGLAITLLPWDMFHQLDMPTSLGITFLIMLALALFGTFLPSPIAFDVILSSILLQVGVPLPYVAVFFFTLGTFSIYAFLIIWRAVSFRVAAFLFLTTVLLGVTAGLLSVAGENYLISKATQQLQTAKSSEANATAYDGNDPVIDRTTDDIADYDSLQPLLDEQSVKYTDTSGSLARTPENIRIMQSYFMPADVSDKRFSRVYGDEVGISQPYLVSYTSFIPSDLVHTTMSVAAGDVHNDGWPDLLVMGDHEFLPNIALYTNIGGHSFKRQSLPVTQDVGMVVLVSLADLNADHWLDIVFATYGGKNYVIYNDHGVFKGENMNLLHEKAGKSITMNLGYSDIDKDGDLDLFEGNWGYGPLYINRESSRNYILKNTGQSFEPHALEGLTGETLSAIFADINGDGNTDLYIGNDYIVAESSDEAFIGDGKGNFRAYREDEDGLGLHGAQSSMSVEFSDIDNDLRPELYIGQIAFSGQYMESMSKIAERQVPYEAMCSLQGIYGMTTEECLKTMRFRLALVRAAHYITDACETLDDPKERNACLAHMVEYKTQCSDASIQAATALSGDASPQSGVVSKRYADICARSQEVENKAGLSLEHNLEVSNASLNNVLLHRGEGQTAYQDQANERKIGYGGWTWNARFADLDQDGWKDLYIANGYYFPMTLASNLFYHNNGDGQFDDKTKEYGLEDYSFSSAYATVDLDRDGDLDIVTVPLDSSVIIYRNENQDHNNSILFTLDDQSTNNTFGYGATVIISYTANGQTIEQRQDVQSSGGYKSFNAPTVHFGLGPIQRVENVKVLWPDGQTSMIEGSLEAGKYYKIIRSKAE